MAAAAVAAAGDGEDPRATTVVQVAAGEAHTLALTGADSFPFVVWMVEFDLSCRESFDYLGWRDFVVARL